MVYQLDQDLEDIRKLLEKTRGLETSVMVESNGNTGDVEKVCKAVLNQGDKERETAEKELKVEKIENLKGEKRDNIYLVRTPPYSKDQEKSSRPEPCRSALGRLWNQYFR